MDIKKTVENIIMTHETNDPFEIAKDLKVIILYADLKNTLGFFNNYKRSKIIHLNCNMPSNFTSFVCAHELGHAVQHSDVNTPFLKRHTLFSNLPLNYLCRTVL